MSDELVERVARAMAVAIYRCIETDRLAHELTQQEVETLARAAIRALKEQTD